MLHAVMIGIDRYQDPRIAQLGCATRDASAFGSLLNARIVPDERCVRVLLDDQATRANIMHAIGEDLARAAGPDDIAIIYFAGHGCPERTAPRDEDWLYLVAHDTEYERIYATGINMVDDVTRWLRRLQVRLAVLFVDACFSGGAGGRTFDGPIRKANAHRFREVPLSIADLDLGAGRVIIAAADDDEVALESDRLGHGVFTYHLLQTLEQVPQGAGTGSHSTGSQIGLAALYERVAAAVHQNTNARQNPVLNGRNVRAALPLLGARPGATASASA